mgnify:CR=1 FL=1
MIINSQNQKLFRTQINGSSKSASVRISTMGATISTFWGRAIIGPEGTDASGELWINFGWNTKGNQLFPAFPDELTGHAVSEAQYERLQSQIKQLMDEKGIVIWAIYKQKM